MKLMCQIHVGTKPTQFMCKQVFENLFNLKACCWIMDGQNWWLDFNEWEAVGST